MTDNSSGAITESWHWQALVKTYSFWGLALVSFFINFSEFANIGLSFRWDEHDFSYETSIRFTYLGILVAGLLSVYFLRKRLKKPLVIFTIIYLLSLFLLRFGSTTHLEIYAAAIFFKNIGYFGIFITILVVLITAKLDLKSFLIAILIIWFWKTIGQALTGIFSFAYTDLERQILGLQYFESEENIKPSLKDVLFYNVLSLLPAVLAVFSTALLKPRMFFRHSSLKAETKPLLPTKTQPSDWLWQDLVSHYKFWGLVLMSFFIGLTQGAGLILGTGYPQAFIDEFGLGLFTFIASTPLFIAGLLTIYFVKGRIKAPLIGFSFLFCISLSSLVLSIPISIAYLESTINPVTYMTLRVFKDVGYYGILLTILSALLTAKLPLKSFLIAVFILSFWFYIGERLSYAYESIRFSYRPIDDQQTPPASYVFYQFIVPILPAAFAILAAIMLKPVMFFSPPDVTVDAKTVKVRDPFNVSLLALIVPFYFLCWLFKQARELKALAPDMHQPSPFGAVCLGLFAPLILPIWFHDVRKGLEPELKDKSPRLMAVVAFFLPAIAAGMAQSDFNQIVNDKPQSS